jgi:hypothetical protein
MKRILHWEPLSILLAITVGILLHYVYGWSMHNRLVAIFGATNESVWEHLKIAFWPEFIIAIVYFVKKKPLFKQFITAAASMLVTTILIIASFFYTYTGIVGNHFLVIDIAIFIFAIIFGFYMFYGIINDKSECSTAISISSTIIIIILIVAFIFFTNHAPKIGMFVS